MDSVSINYTHLFLTPFPSSQSSPLLISPDFQHILRILNTNIDGRRKVRLQQPNIFYFLPLKIKKSSTR